MNLFGLNISVSRARTPAAQKALSIPPEAWVRGEDVAPGSAQVSNAYQQVVWVYRAVNALAEQVANIPFRFSVGAPGGERLITAGPLHQFYARPHPQLNQFQYWELRVIWLMLRGECFRVPVYQDEDGSVGAAFKVQSSRFKVQSSPTSRLHSVLILDPAHFQHIVQDHQLVGWRYTGLGAQTPLASQVLLPEEVWFERLPNPFDFWRGLSPLYLAGLAVQTDFAAGAFMKGLIENNGDVGLVVRTTEPLGPEQREQLLRALKDRKRRAGMADQPLVLGKGAEVIKPTLSSTDLQFLDNRKFSRAEICAAFGVPEEVVATTDVAKYDVMTGARLNFIENRVLPLCRRLEAEEEVTVKRIDPRAVGWFDVENLPILQQARRERLRAARTGFEMGIPFNELNRVLDLGFKPLPWGDAGYLPSSFSQVRPAGSALAPEAEGPGATQARRPRAVAPGGTGPLGGPAVENPFERMVGLLQAEPERVGDADGSGEPELPQFLKPGMQVLAGKLRRYFFEQRGRVLAVLENRNGSVVPIRIVSDAAPAAKPAELLPALFDLADENRCLAERVQPVLISLLELCAVERALERGQVAVSLPAASRDQFWAEREHGLRQMNQGTLEMLTTALGDWQRAGAKPAQLAACVKALYNDASQHRAACLARVHAQATLQAAEQAVLASEK